MRHHNQNLQAWCALDKKTKEAIRASDNAHRLHHDGSWVPCSFFDEGRVYRAPIVEKQPLGPEDIKQGDVVRVIGTTEWFYIEPRSKHVIIVNHSDTYITYEELMKNHEIRSIGGGWRPCEK